ncbi:antA/AntB antirepressor family protein [Tenacibaculum finnmarkense genomovar finnmarkense]|uniref:antA/AntB antirepressor family protein n=1 Tax=Tenacibaculum finnmarkense TaxID=2781243 RepID=UPI001EFB87D0|nr:antA/AntB antirepressor family protein [Tenacibaculum finnmarkense]MCG8212929.1 antA/AntB antirepressor family protein [Tenacibaculum finnmarkense genomovar finnmarkense]MCG8231200.1 antA/AntB antirepressor family protein [Tenacibaculum finnmarkense genomovar finnmarkense]MCG8884585.1 phage antirepressor Ant [Tenacibaculum finnmarkense]MCG8897165.1 phage antirepressor Ant [Tenacibaculum finnmarkense]MCG8903228.1 phage antirepressor Ant [Tenacibaculum finnmarkense]
MKNLIQITEQNGNNVISARELHGFLEVGKDFSTWVKDRINKYEFIENEDFEVFPNIGENSNSGRPRKDYAISLDMAKELSMIEHNEKGKQARRYFIESEKKLKKNKVIDLSDASVVLQLAQNFAEEQKKRVQLESKVRTLTPKADVFDKVMATDTKIDIGQTAKILDLPFGRNTLFKELRERGVFFKNKNEPKQEYLKRGYFELKEVLITRENHEDLIKLKVLVSQKGLAFISKLFDSKIPQHQLAMIN